MNYSEFANSERTGWGQRAKGYREATARATLQTVPSLLAHARLFPAARVLDAGCGPGYVAAIATLLGADAEGLDFAQEMVDEARNQFPHIVFRNGDVESLPYADKSFDAVLSNITLFHVTNPERAMSEGYRVLKTGGRYVFSQWLGPDRSECYQLLFDVLARHADISRADPAPNAYILSDEKKVFEMMKHAGFDGITFETVPNELHAPGPSFFDFFMKFGVRVPLILERQEESVRERIRTEIDEMARRYFDGAVYKIPMPSLVCSGVAR